MEIVWKDPHELKAYENNPRNNTPAIEAVAASIHEFGFQVPVLIDRNDTLIAGHTRTEAAIKEDVTSIPCIYVDNLNDEQIRAFRLADNKVSEFAEWDYSNLMDELAEISGIDMSQFGFPELDDNDLDVKDSDFLADACSTKNHKTQKVICPECGHEFIP